MACRNGLTKLAQVLCDSGTMDNGTFDRICIMKDNQEKDCLQIAMEKGHQDICDMIRYRQV